MAPHLYPSQPSQGRRRSRSELLLTHISVSSYSHHAGAVLTMFAAFRTASMPAWIFVAFNGFIHS